MSDDERRPWLRFKSKAGHYVYLRRDAIHAVAGAHVFAGAHEFTMPDSAKLEPCESPLPGGST